jgi:hypothetical protein
MLFPFDPDYNTCALALQSSVPCHLQDANLRSSTPSAAAATVAHSNGPIACHFNSNFHYIRTFAP